MKEISPHHITKHHVTNQHHTTTKTRRRITSHFRIQGITSHNVTAHLSHCHDHIISTDTSARRNRLQTSDCKGRASNEYFSKEVVMAMVSRAPACAGYNFGSLPSSKHCPKLKPATRRKQCKEAASSYI